MPLWNRPTRAATPSPQEAAAALRDEMDQTALQLVDQAHAVARPDEVGHTYKELELDERAIEQEPLFDADGEHAARGARIAAAGLSPRAQTARQLADDHLPSVARARQRYENCLEALGAHRVRGVRGKLWYGARTALLLTGDIAGISGAAISLGEVPLNAFLLAGSASVATIAAGLVGKDVRAVYLRNRRARVAEHLGKAQEPYRHLFTGGQGFSRILRGIVFASAAVGLVVGISIYGLRASIEGSLSGLVFGALALAVAIGSFLSSFAYGDEIADQIDAARHDYEVELRRARALARSRAWNQHERHQTRAMSIRDEYAQRGTAARIAVTGAKWRLLARNPGVVGHGQAAGRPEAIGRKARTGGDSR